MNCYTIKNDKISVSILQKGAEIVSVKKDGKELIWQGHPDIWPDHAINLFPMVGRLKNKTYTVYGNEYNMDIHGFARDTVFDVIDSSHTSIKFMIKSTEETKKVYPFDFEFIIFYKLEDTLLIKEYITKNLSTNVMYYEVGGHEGYNLAIFDGEKMTDYYLKFPSKTEVYTYTSDADIMMNEKTERVPLKSDTLPINLDLFKNDALVFDKSVGDVAEIWGPRGRLVRVEFSGFPYLGVWSRYKNFDTNYICIEPWSSLPDGNFLDFKLENKLNVRKINPGDTETLSYTMLF